MRSVHNAVCDLSDLFENLPRHPGRLYTFRAGLHLQSHIQIIRKLNSQRQGYGSFALSFQSKSTG